MSSKLTGCVQDQRYGSWNVQVCPEWEAAHFRTAEFLDGVFLGGGSGRLGGGGGGTGTASGRHLDPAILVRVIGLYAASLRHGTHHAHHALPRLVTLWLDNAAKTVDIVRQYEARKVLLSGRHLDPAILVRVIGLYAASLRHGTHHAHHALPRLVTLWLDNAAKTVDIVRQYEARKVLLSGRHLDPAILVRVIGLYAASLRHGTHHAHHALPRLVTLWLDNAAKTVDIVRQYEARKVLLSGRHLDPAILVRVIGLYAASLRHGTHHAHHALPRLVTLWLDNAAKTVDIVRQYEARKVLLSGRHLDPAILVRVIGLYAASLRHGTHHAHHALPRLVTLWLDNAAKTVDIVRQYEARKVLLSGRHLDPSILVRVIGLYAASLRHGTHHAHHALPRLVTLWLDNAAKTVDIVRQYEARKVLLSGRHLDPSILVRVIGLYAASLRHGTHHAHHALPRLVTLWLDNAAKTVDIVRQYEARKVLLSGRHLDPAILVRVIGLYAASLRHGTHHAHHALPRLVTLWLDNAAKTVDIVRQYEARKGKAKTKAEKESFDRTIGANKAGTVRLNATMETELGRLPSTRLFPAFSQLISRVAHPDKGAQTLLIALLARLVRDFPDQSLWLAISVYRSDPASPRALCCKDVMEKAMTRNPDLSKRFRLFRTFCDQLVALAEAPVPSGVETLNMDAMAPALLKFFQEPNRAGKVMIPVESMMTGSVGEESGNLGADMFSQTDPAAPSAPNATSHPSTQPARVYIAGFSNHIRVMRSLQKPKVISFRGSDGTDYKMMLKNGDDLRKDSRLMDFNAVVNAALRQDADGRRRGLHVRRFGVTPLGQGGGLIEWVEGLKPMRACMDPIINATGGGFTSTVRRTETAFVQTNKGQIKKLLKRYKELHLPAHPRVLGLWFRHNFPEPSGWYTARLNYTRTTAVMAMVGFVLGLGDRHAENILLDTRSGDILHVDFNLLFNKGEGLGIPEIVPFRLTRNTVDGFGPLGVEGPFRKSAEVTLAILREQAGTLRTVMEAFLHDPLVEWSKERPVAAAGPSQVAPPSTATIVAEETLAFLVARLSGYNVTPRLIRQEEGQKPRPLNDLLQRLAAKSLPLNVPSQVDKLMTSAADPELLCQMFFGWAPFL